jgi:DNA-binding transcriptional MerR regulator
MKIGELSERTDIPTRMLRYYEQQGLISAERAANGYRSYTEGDVDRAKRVRGLIQAGLSTRMTKVVLDIELQVIEAAPPECSRALAEELATELAVLEARLVCLEKSRDAVKKYLAMSPHGELVPG